MRAIAKVTEPPSLVPYCDFDYYAQRDVLRHALVTEQRGICCYCMGLIRNGRTTTKIEHWHCQSHYTTERLSYRNLLGACLGGDGQPPRQQHCVTRKGDQDNQWNLADLAHPIEARLHQEPDGTIRTTDSAFDGQLDEVVNLSLPILKNNQEAVRVALIEWGGIQVHGRTGERRIGGAGDPAPYSQVAVWWLNQRLARMPG